MISILTALMFLAPVAHAQDCGLVQPIENDTADYDEDADRMVISAVGSKVQLDPGVDCNATCIWTLVDLDNGDGQAVGRLTEIDESNNAVTDNQTSVDSTSIQANRVWYTAPDDLNDCRDVAAQVRLDCSTEQVVENDPDDFIEVLTESPYVAPCSVSGGGCIAPQGTGIQQASGWLLLPLVGLVMRRRQERP